ncbi:MAG: trans-4-hydroxy-L-proline dehydratase [Anaerolineae bacterium]|nr:glycyl radical protein [Chloroflexota bacterium]
MSERVARLRTSSLEAKPSLSSERARLLTEWYREHTELLSPAVRRARAFSHLLQHVTVHIAPDELIVGEKGPRPKAAPTYPELCCHSLQDLHVLDTREKTSFAVAEDDLHSYTEEIIPFWRGRTMREAILAQMSESWRAGYEAGIFTEFMEQRSPGHTVLDDKLYRKGINGLLADIERAREQIDPAVDPRAYERLQELQGMEIAGRAIIAFAARYADEAHRLAEAEADLGRKGELLSIEQVCRWVPANPPRTFHEAIQSYWFVHLGVTLELNPWDSFSPGKLDQHLAPYYGQGIADGSLTREQAEELLQCLWIKFNNQPAPPKVGVTAAESGTYTDFAQINLGGVRPDGSDGVNEVTMLLLDVVEEMRLLQPSASAHVSKRSPDAFIRRAGRILRTGFGQPSLFNSDVVVQELLRQGKSLADARQGGTSGCVETGAFGKENYALTGYMNLPKILELALNDGLDPVTGTQLGPHTGSARRMESMEDLWRAFTAQLGFWVGVKIGGNNLIERLFAEHMPAPFLSLLIDDCISAGRDYHDGGARYNSSYIQGVGLGTITDALSAIQSQVFEERSVSLPALVAALNSNFEGQERLRQRMLNRAPKYGNDDDAADALMLRVFEAYYDAIDGRPNTRGGVYHINLLPTTVHVYFGSVTGATADGRRAGMPLSEGISPVQGMDRRGPTAAIRSAAKMDHVRTGGTLLNQKLAPELLEGEENLNNLVYLVRSYFGLDGHHIQFNVVDSETLRDAQLHPEQHRDLIVRVAGYSDYFCDLGRTLQDEIIARTEHRALARQ